MFKALWKLLFPSFTAKSTTTVRYAFPILVLTALLAGSSSGLFETGSYVSIISSSATVKESEHFTLTIKANAQTPVNAIDITIDYPSEKMRIDSVDVGTSVISFWAEEPYAKNGHIYLRGGMYKRGFMGEHTIATVRATALTSGMTQISTKETTFIAGDGMGTEVHLTKTGKEDTQIIIIPADGSLAGKASITILTDLDGDGKVDLRDISAFMGAWFTRKSTFDFDGDGRMTFKDFSILLSDSFLK